MDEVLTIGIVGVCLYGILSVFSFMNLLLLRYIIFIDNQNLRIAKRSLTILIFIFIATTLKLLFYVGMIMTEVIEIGFYVIYKISAYLLLLAALLISKQLITIGGLIDLNSPVYTIGYFVSAILVATTITCIVVGGIKGIPSSSKALSEDTFQITMYFDALNELLRMITTILSLSISSIQLYVHIHEVIKQNRSRIPVLNIEEDDDNENYSKRRDSYDGEERKNVDFDAADDDDDDYDNDDDDLKSVLRNLKIFIVYILCTQLSGIIMIVLRLSAISNVNYYTLIAFIFSDFIPDGGYILAMLYLAKGIRSQTSHMLVRSNELREKLHYHHHVGRKNLKRSYHNQARGDNENQVIEHYFTGASIFGFGDASNSNG